MLITSNLTTFTYNIAEQVTIRASIDNILDRNEQEVLKKQIQAISGVKNITFSTGKEELESYKKEYENEKNLFSMYEGNSSPIQDTFLVEISKHADIKSINILIKELKGITSSEYGGEATNTLMNGLSAIRSGGIIFITFLVFIAIFLIANKIKISIYTRKYEIAIMRFVGASNWCIKCPMMIEGIVIGVLGSTLPIVLTVFGYQYLYDALNGSFFTTMFTLQKSLPLTIQISFILLAIGVLVGLSGSYFSTSKYLRWKR